MPISCCGRVAAWNASSRHWRDVSLAAHREGKPLDEAFYRDIQKQYWRDHLGWGGEPYYLSDTHRPVYPTTQQEMYRFLAEGPGKYLGISTWIATGAAEWAGDFVAAWKDWLNPGSGQNALTGETVEGVDAWGKRFIGSVELGTVFVGGGTISTARGVSNAATEVIPGFSSIEAKIIAEAQGILKSSELAKIQAAHIAGTPAEVSINGRLIQYEPELSASGMTMFGENGFLIGREAFTSQIELQKTILHELHRLSTSVSSSGVSGALASQETKSAFNFAEKASKYFSEGKP